jgi:AcrR family transcriptional regulator
MKGTGGMAAVPEESDRRQQILEAALAIADEKGLEAVTMRAVAARVGVTAMALYPHVVSKDDLLDGLVGRLLAELSPPDPRLGWQCRLRHTAHSARAAARRHPAVMPLLFARPAVTLDAVRVVDSIYQALLDAGVPDREVARVERLVSTLVLGYAISEAGGRFAAGQPRERRAMAAGADLPAHRRLASQLDAEVSWDAEFEAALDDLTTLVEGVARSSGERGLRRPRPRSPGTAGAWRAGRRTAGGRRRRRRRQGRTWPWRSRSAGRSRAARWR